MFLALFFRRGKGGGCTLLSMQKVYIIALGKTRCYQSQTRTCRIYNMPPKGRKNLRVKLDAVAAEDLRRKRKAKEMVQEEAEETEESDSEEEEDEDVEADETPRASKPKKKKPKKLREEGTAMEKSCAVDKFGFSSLDGNKYLDDCAPGDFPDSFHFNVSKQTELGNQFFSARYASLRGRSKKDGSLYSSPCVFLQKDWQGKYLTFTLPDRHVTALRKFLEEVEREKQSTL